MTVEEKLEAKRVRQREACRRWTAKNREKSRACSKAWREANPDKAKAGRRVSYEANKEDYAKRNRQWRNDHPDQVIILNRDWTIKNREKVNQKNRERNALRVGLQEKFSQQDRQVILAQFNHTCFHCGSKDHLQIDHHLPLSRGHVLCFGNAVVLCARCNAGKRNRLPEDYYAEHELALLSQLLKAQKKLS